MRFSSYTLAMFVALAGFAAANPVANPEAGVGEAAMPVDEALDLVSRACRKRGKPCTRDAQCCTGECEHGRCARHGGDDNLMARACRKRGKACTRDRQCCSGECEHGRCARHGGDDN